MQKGEGKDYANDEHKVDGMSGATLTGKGVNNMLVDYLACYEKYLKKNSAKEFWIMRLTSENSCIKLPRTNMALKEQDKIPVTKIHRASKFVGTGAKIGANYLKHYQ